MELALGAIVFCAKQQLDNASQSRFAAKSGSAGAGDVRRTTASVSYNQPFERGNWASSLIWGRNHENHGGEMFNLNGYVAESTVNFRDKNYLYTRLELVGQECNCLRAADRASPGHHR